MLPGWGQSSRGRPYEIPNKEGKGRFRMVVTVAAKVILPRKRKRRKRESGGENTPPSIGVGGKGPRGMPGTKKTW